MLQALFFVVLYFLTSDVQLALCQAGSAVDILALKSDPSGERVKIPWQRVVGLPKQQMVQRKEFSMSELATLEDIIEAHKNRQWPLTKDVEKQLDVLRHCEEALKALEPTPVAAPPLEGQQDVKSDRPPFVPEEAMMRDQPARSDSSGESDEVVDVVIYGVDLHPAGADFVPVVPVAAVPTSETSVIASKAAAPAVVVETANAQQPQPQTQPQRFIQMAPLMPVSSVRPLGPSEVTYDRIDYFAAPPIFLPPVGTVPVGTVPIGSIVPAEKPMVAQSRHAGESIREGSFHRF